MAEYRFFDYQPPQSDLKQEVVEGLLRPDKQLSPKFFYDEGGSKLFEEITQLPEYYLTRTEMGIFDAHEAEMRERLNHSDCVVEYGSGNNMKIRRLLELAAPKAYVPLDISSDHLQANARELHEAYPDISVYPVCADFTQPIELPPPVRGLNKTAFFPGSSIGNFDPSAARTFLGNVAQTLEMGGQLLIGVDCKKDVAVLEPAYDDAQGVTARFNLNLLLNLNDLLGADFDPAKFSHRATYNEALGRIEMHLVAKEAHAVRVGEALIEFEQGEAVHTESSYKYAPDEFLHLAGEAGFEPVRTWQDDQFWFAVYLLAVR